MRSTRRCLPAQPPPIQKLGQVPPGEGVTAMRLEFKVGSGLEPALAQGAWTGPWGRPPARHSHPFPLVGCY